MPELNRTGNKDDICIKDECGVYFIYSYPHPVHRYNSSLKSGMWYSSRYTKPYSKILCPPF